MNSGTAPLVELIGVSKSYPSTGGAPPVHVLRNVSLRLHPGEALCIVGPSGSGKSTLLNLMGTLDRPTSGTVRLAGQDLATCTEQGLARVRNEFIGFVFQAHHLLPQCTVLENVLIPALARRRRISKELVERGRILLDRVGLAARSDHRPGQLSGGEGQRVAVVRALINRPRLLLADEPTGSLDQSAAANLGALLHELNREEGVTLVLVTHSSDLARQLDRRCELRNGDLLPLAEA